jgi:hypothetical protein
MPKSKIKEDVLESYVFPVLLYCAPTWSLTEKEKRILQTCQRKMERSILQVVWSNIVTNAEVRQRTNEGHRGSSSQSQVEVGRPGGKTGPAQMGTCYINVGRKDRQKENEATEDLMGRHVQESSRRAMVTNSQSEWSTYNIRKSDISRNSSTSDKTLELSLGPRGGRCAHGILPRTGHEGPDRE